ncbi:carbamoyl-phosphate synthase large subunit [Hydrogenibacillus schlegelii]|uniref:Uncharacterized protein n=1 Tax=Hydrogenibacillus schlegelii TaxID=1484 RepID=A0A132MI63_HYDSH|nr:carbamoyl-phosphate synthase large subunit [Hydrogenibacillus schlegelii]KWW97111.1 hypothetical protein TR75_10250 [Hydrogenibacillus schlegelii]OAR03863.1 hypothetical protein SA87_03235 [Hydrogenibacillus schlegelii]
MPLRRDLRRVLILGSGPVVIGQGAEFDYAGSEACRALRSAGLEVVLINNNPATIMTDAETADRIYFEPLTPEAVEAVIERERPDGLLAGLGGQTGLNLARGLAERDAFRRFGVALLGTPLSAIEDGEDRERFRRKMIALGEPVPPSEAVASVEAALAFADAHGYPVFVRPAYTLGGTGGGSAGDPEALREVVGRALQASPIHQALVETSLLGLREIEFEVVRDADDRAVVVAAMENVDPVGVHTGDSIVVAPPQSLPPAVVRRLAGAAARIVRAIGVIGGANVQFAYDPGQDRYFVIELNPRVSRSSALASKATGYPIAYVSALLAAGFTLPEIELPTTGRRADEPPVLRDVVVKWPHFPFDAFPGMSRRLGTEMRATGETMTIGGTLAEALLKGLRALELGLDHLIDPEVARLSDAELRAELGASDDRRLFRLAEALRRGMPEEEAARASDLPLAFVRPIAEIVAAERRLREEGLQAAAVRAAKSLGFSDRTIAVLTGETPDAVRRFREANAIRPRWTDGGRAAPGRTPPLWYGTYAGAPEEEAPSGGREGGAAASAGRPDGRPTVVVLGAGPIRIGQGIEFDYATVHAILEAKARGYRVAIVNTNPETVSTDYTVADAVYVEPASQEEVLAVLERERPVGVLVQFGGQTALRLAHAVDRAGWPILGTPLSAIDAAEDRAKFDAVLERLGLRRPPGIAARTAEEALEGARRLGFPLVVRPSYVLGGREMAIVRDEAALRAYLGRFLRERREVPVLLDRYVEGVELEVDALTDGREVLIPGILKHVERAGVHSGDSIAVFPAPDVPEAIRQAVAEATAKIALDLGVRGLLNVQFAVQGSDVFVLEANPRASRTLPFLSKATGLPLLRWATAIMLGETLASLGAPSGLLPPPEAVFVKAPVFSFAKLARVDVTLGPVMKSTGEVMARERDPARALLKALRMAGALPLPLRAVLFSIADADKPAAIPIARAFSALGVRLFATPGTAATFARHGLAAASVEKIGGPPPTVLDLIRERTVQVVVNTYSPGSEEETDGFRIRRAAVERGLSCLTALDTAAALAEALQATLRDGVGEGRR